MNPKHIDEVPKFIKDDKGKNIPRRAVAPYNFVELPEKVVEVEAEELPSSDRYHLDRHTGRIECSLTTSSPLYIRCGLTPANFTKYSEYSNLAKDATEEQKKKWEEEKKEWDTERRTILSPFFTYQSDTLPVIPGSSLRGMLRNLVEIISFSKINRVSNENRLFFRAVAANPEKDSLGKAYKRYVDPKKVKAGYLKKDREGWYIQPAQEAEQGATFAWVREITLNLPNLKKFNDDKYESQYIPVSYESVAVDNTDRAKRLFANNVELPDTHPKKGVLVTSGNMKQGNEPSPRRNHCVIFECLVFEANSTSRKLRVDNTAIEHYSNALTDFQKKLPFDKDWGMLAENRPVFYLPPQNDDDTVAFFGQSPNFRIPYSPESNGHATTVVDFIPENLRKLASLDFADAIFGWVKQESESEKLPQNFDKQKAGRVCVTDALYQNNQNGIWYEDKPLTPQILSGPKPSCFPHYLVQQSADKSELKHYTSQPVTETVIRGHKLYWHKGNNPNFKLKKVIDSSKKDSDTQTTLIKPISQGVTFKFDIHFENLSDVELGVLLWVLKVAKDDAYRLKIGMGKPLGLGAIKIEPNLYLSRRKQRYQKLFDNNYWEKEEITSNENISIYVDNFEKYMLKKLDHNGDFNNLCRIQMLLVMLQWPGIEDVEKTTRYMEIERDCKKHHIGQCKQTDKKTNEYKERPVLPNPLDVMGIKIECDRPSTFLSKKSTEQTTQEFLVDQIVDANTSLSKKYTEQTTQEFLVDQIVDAKVVDIQVEEGKKLKTIITYEIQCSDCLAKEEVYKKKVFLDVGNSLKVSIVKAEGKSIRKVKRFE